MAAGAKAFLVIRHPDGLGSVFALHGGKSYILGRAKTNEVLLNDDLCSRQHAEVYFGAGQWRIRDCGSLNGTRVNEQPLVGEHELAPGDEVLLGRSRLVFVEELSQLPTLSTGAGEPNGGVSIMKRMGQTRYDLADAEQPVSEETPASPDRHRISRDLSLLYRLALNMGTATTHKELVEVVLEGLLETTPADIGAVLSIKGGRHFQVVTYQSKLANESYARVSDFIANEVLKTKEAVLAEDVARLDGLQALDRKPRTEATNLAARHPRAEACSLICAPVLVGERIEALIHLYCIDPMKALSPEDLELTVAVSKQLAVVSQALQRQIDLSEENQRLKAQVAAEVELVGTSPPILEIQSQIARIAGTTATVLIRGESGVGKELVARALHLASPRRQAPFVCLNCAALAESLLESELFGHEKGAFTGATDRKIGKFEAAHGGTIFLDEIGEMNPSAQAKLLRILEGHPYERVGGSEPVRVNVRVVAATNRSLEEAVNAGQFRRDLYFRLQVIEIRVPPLRERPSDIPLLTDYFLRRFLRETGRKIREITPAALEKLRTYDWPGNVRELRNVLERAVALSTGTRIDAGDIWLSNLEQSPCVPAPSPATYQPLSLEDVEKLHIQATLRHTDWNKSQASNILGIERSTLDRKIRAYDIRR
jgi:Nif-specific regulatory protein